MTNSTTMGRISAVLASAAIGLLTLTACGGSDNDHAAPKSSGSHKAATPQHKDEASPSSAKNLYAHMPEDDGEGGTPKFIDTLTVDDHAITYRQVPCNGGPVEENETETGKLSTNRTIAMFPDGNNFEGNVPVTINEQTVTMQPDPDYDPSVWPSVDDAQIQDYVEVNKCELPKG